MARSPTRSRGARRTAPTAPGRILRDRGGGRPLPLLHRRLGALHGPRDLDGDPGQPGLRHRARLRRVHAVPRQPRVHGALDRAHASLARPLPGLARRARPAATSSSTGSSRAASTRTCASRARRRSPPARCDGIAIGGSLGADKPQMYEVVGWTTAALPEDRPRHLLGIGDDRRPDRAASSSGSTRFDCAMPTRLGRHGMALVPDPEQRWRVDLTKSAWRDSQRAADGRLPVPGLRDRLLARLPALPARKQAS